MPEPTVTVRMEEDMSAEPSFTRAVAGLFAQGIETPASATLERQ
jgi:hypothetical protein